MSDQNSPLDCVSQRVRGLPESSTLRINEMVAKRRAKGEMVYHMGFGESPFRVPRVIALALAEAACANSYAPALGLPELRQKALDYFPPRLGFSGSGQSVMVGPGSKDLIFALQLALEGDLLLPTPSWVSYAPQARLAGSETIQIPTRVDDFHTLTGALLDETISKARAHGLNPRKLILNYPNNPTGLGIAPQDLSNIADVCRAAGIVVISDEIYALVSHGGPHKSIAGLYPEGTIVTTGLSKHLSLGGYRLGFAFIPSLLSNLLPAMRAVASETWSCVSHPVQLAALPALDGSKDLEAHITHCTHVHGLVCNYVRDRLAATGIAYPALSGGFYMYPNFTPFAKDLNRAYGVKTSLELSRDLMLRANIATLPGSDFGEADDVLTLRLAITDYDGKAALDYLAKHPECGSDQFVRNTCPRIVAACDGIAQYLSDASA